GPPPAPAEIPRARRAAVRDLHTRLPRGRPRPARAQPRGDGDGGPLLAGGQSLPLHGIRQDHQGGDGHGRGNEASLTMADTVATSPDLGQSYVGTRTVRPDGVDKVTGRARFAADFNLAGQLVGCVLRSPHPHARIISIDTSKAEQLPGV